MDIVTLLCIVTLCVFRRSQTLFIVIVQWLSGQYKAGVVFFSAKRNRQGCESAPFLSYEPTYQRVFNNRVYGNQTSLSNRSQGKNVPHVNELTQYKLPAYLYPDKEISCRVIPTPRLRSSGQRVHTVKCHC